MPPYTAVDLLSIMDNNGIDAVVTCAPYSSIGKDRTYDEANWFLVESVKEVPGRILPFVRVNPHLRENAQHSIREAIGDWGFHGIKLHPRNEAFPINNEELVYPIAEAAAKFGVPILIHTGEPDTYGFAQPTLVGGLADAFPDVTLIVGHMGKRLYEDAILVAKWFENVILETSFRSHREIARAVNRVGADRVIYGSDMPFGVPEIEMMKVRLSGIREGDEEKVMGANIAHLLGLGDWT